MTHHIRALYQSDGVIKVDKLITRTDLELVLEVGFSGRRGALELCNKWNKQGLINQAEHKRHYLYVLLD